MDVVYVGIDPGNDGGIAVLLPGGAEPLTFKLDGTPTGASRLLQEVFHHPDVYPYYRSQIRICLEKVGGRPGERASSAFTFGAGWGGIVSILDWDTLVYKLETPANWRKGVGLAPGKDRVDNKKRSRELCHQLFPSLRCVKSYEDGRLEAALIALYAKQNAAKLFP